MVKDSQISIPTLPPTPHPFSHLQGVGPPEVCVAEVAPEGELPRVGPLVRVHRGLAPEHLWALAALVL